MPQEYPLHIYEPIRREIAQSYAFHEFKKLFRSLNKPSIELLKVDINSWCDGINYELAPVHDFWNGIAGISRGFKLKNIVKMVTAENIIWKKTSINIQELIISVDLANLKEIGNPPYTFEIIQKYLTEHPNKLTQFQKDDIKYLGNIDKNSDPIIAIKDSQGCNVIDGSARTLRGIINGVKYLDVYLGRFSSNETRALNYWVTTGSLLDLVDIAKRAKRIPNEEVIGAIKIILKNLFANSQIAQINYKSRVLYKNTFSEKLVEGLLASDN